MSWIILNVIPFMIRWWKPIAIGCVVSVFYLLAWGRGAAHAELACQREQEAQRAYAQKLMTIASNDYERIIAQMHEKFIATSNELEVSLAKHPEYHSCMLPVDGLHTLRNAIARGYTR